MSFTAVYLTKKVQPRLLWVFSTAKVGEHTAMLQGFKTVQSWRTEEPTFCTLGHVLITFRAALTAYLNIKSFTIQHVRSVFFFNWYINTIKAFKEFKSTHDLSIPSQTMQLSMCLCISAIKILRSPETQGEGPRLSLSRAHMPVQHTHTHNPEAYNRKRKPGYCIHSQRGNCKNVSLFGGYSVCQSETNTFLNNLHTLYSSASQWHWKQESQIATCLKNC